MFVQQASVSCNWTDEDLNVLLSVCEKSVCAHSGTVGEKMYSDEEKAEIRKREEENFAEEA